MATRYEGVLFDLFGTLVQVDPRRLPAFVIDGREVRATVPGLRGLLAELLPDVALEDFARALRAVSEEMAAARATDHIERPSRERFRRALARLGHDGERAHEAALYLSRRHLALIAEATVFPPAHAALLATIVGRRRVGVVSNFDDSSAAYAILVRHGIAAALDVVVISEALGVRKPHPVLVRAGLRGLDVAPTAALLVGDTFAEDVLAARAAGVDAAWIDAAGAGVPPGVERPRFVVGTLPEVGTLLDAS